MNLFDMLQAPLGSPEQQALTAISLGLLNNAGGRHNPMPGLLVGLQGASAALSAGEDKKRALAKDALQQRLLEAQITETLAQGQQRTAQADQLANLTKMRNAAITQLNAPGAPNQYGVEGGGITLGGVREPMRPVSGGLQGMSIDDIARAKIAGLPDLSEEWKLSQVGVAQDPGKFYTLNGQRSYLGDPKVGLDLSSGGHVSLMPGFLEGQSALAGATKEAEARGTAGYDVMPALNPDGSPGYGITRRQYVDSLRPGGSAPPPSAPPAPVSRGPFDPLAMAQAEALSSRQPVTFNLSGRGGQFDPTGNLQPMRTGLGPADKWSYDKDRGLMVNDLGQTRAVVNGEGAPIGSPKQEAAAQSNNQFLEATKQARMLLAKNPTGSAVGSAQDTVAGWFGGSPAGAKEAAQLRTISGWLTSNVPRMEGPQSNYDVQNYREMAALVGDSMRPVSQRLAALDSAENLIRKYADLNRATPANPGLKDPQQADLQAAIAAELERRRRTLSGGATGSW